MREFLNFGYFGVGPDPKTGEPNSWGYWPGNPPVPMTPEDNARFERCASSVFNGFPMHGVDMDVLVSGLMHRALTKQQGGS